VFAVGVGVYGPGHGIALDELALLSSGFAEAAVARRSASRIPPIAASWIMAMASEAKSSRSQPATVEAHADVFAVSTGDSGSIRNRRCSREKSERLRRMDSRSSNSGKPTSPATERTTVPLVVE